MLNSLHLQLQSAPGGAGVIIQLETAAGAAIKNFNEAKGEHYTSIIINVRTSLLCLCRMCRYQGTSVKIFTSQNYLRSFVGHVRFVLGGEWFIEDESKTWLYISPISQTGRGEF